MTPVYATRGFNHRDGLHAAFSPAFIGGLPNGRLSDSPAPS
jgi:hypothetical protein